MMLGWKRQVSFLLAILLLVSLCACGSDVKEPLAESLEEQIAPEETPEEPEEPEEPVHEHSYRKTMKVPDCYEGGYTDYTCACGDTYRVEGAQPIGHSYADEVVAPTFVSEGYTVHTCAFCGHSFEDSPVDIIPNGIEDGSFFDDAAFVGDSIMVSIKTFEMLNDRFGESTFLCRPSYSIRMASEHTMGMEFRGRHMQIPDALQACGAKKAFILIAMNDIATIFLDYNSVYWENVIREIREKNPDITLFIMMGTPVYEERGMLTNAQMDLYNQQLRQIAEDNGCFFVDNADALKDETGFLKAEYCSDAYVHLSMEGSEVWEKSLKAWLLEHLAELPLPEPESAEEE